MLMVNMSHLLGLVLFIRSTQRHMARFTQEVQFAHASDDFVIVQGLERIPTSYMPAIKLHVEVISFLAYDYILAS